jgi:hypothetical protein
MTLAVLTGDLIASQGLGRDGLAAALAALAAGAADIARWEGCAGTSFGRFRGDGWQMTPQERLDLENERRNA